MKTYFNPFHHILEVSTSPYAPHTRTLRTSLKQKFLDALYVVAGKLSKRHFYQWGLLDYFPFPFLQSLTLEKIRSQGENASVSAVLIGFSIALLVFKTLIAAILLIPVAPFILATHLLAYAIAGKQLTLAKNVKLNQDGVLDQYLPPTVTMKQLFSKQSNRTVVGEVKDGIVTIPTPTHGYWGVVREEEVRALQDLNCLQSTCS